MQTKSRWVLILLSLCMFLSGCSLSLKLVDPGNTTVGFESSVEGSDLSLAGPGKPIPSAAQSVMEHMSLSQKVGQLVLVDIDDTAVSSEAEALFKEYQVSGILLSKQNLVDEAQISSLIHQGNELAAAPHLMLRLPLLWCLAEEGGAIQSLPLAMGRLDSAQNIGYQDYSASRQYGERIGGMFQQVGINTFLGPVFDVAGRNALLANLAFSTDVVRVAYHASEEMLGLRHAGVISIAKYFPGSGDATTSVYSPYATVDKNYAQLLGNELLPFVAAIDRSVEAVLVSHVLYPQIDPDSPASLSPTIVEGLLRGELGYKGIVICDDVHVEAIEAEMTPAEAAVRAIQSGCDMVMVKSGVEEQVRVLEALLQACVEGRISPERLNDALSKVITLKQNYFMND